MIWVIKDFEAKTPTYEIIRGNIHDYYKRLGWRYVVYAVEDTDIYIPSPNTESKLFYFKGKRCNLIDADNFTQTFVDWCQNISIPETYFNKNEKLKRNLELIQNYPYKDEVVSIEKHTKTRWFRKPETWYDFKFKGFVVEKTNETIEETVSSFVITEK